MRAIAGLALSTLLLSGCLQAPQALEDTTKLAAKTAVNSVISKKFPGVDAEVYVDCVIDNATPQQMLSLAATAVTGVQSNTINTVTAIASEGETLKCIAQGSLSNIFG